jgi:hypothetical protein
MSEERENKIVALVKEAFIGSLEELSHSFG